MPASPALSQTTKVFSEQQGLKGKESTEEVSAHLRSAPPPKFGWEKKPTPPMTSAEGRRDLESRTSESLSHLPLKLWDFPPFLIHPIAIFWNAFVRPLLPAAPRTRVASPEMSLLRCVTGGMCRSCRTPGLVQNARVPGPGCQGPFPCAIPCPLAAPSPSGAEPAQRSSSHLGSAAGSGPAAPGI